MTWTKEKSLRYMLLVHAQYEKLLARHGFSESQSPSLADQVTISCKFSLTRFVILYMFQNPDDKNLDFQ